MKNTTTYSFGGFLAIICLFLTLYFGFQADSPVWDFEWAIKTNTVDHWWAFMFPADFLSNRFLQILTLVVLLGSMWFMLVPLFGKKRTILSFLILITMPGFLLFFKALNPDLIAGVMQSILFFSGVQWIIKRDSLLLAIAGVVALGLLFFFPYHGLITLIGLLAFQYVQIGKKWVWTAFGLLCCILLLLDIYLLNMPFGLIESLREIHFLMPWVLLPTGLLLWLGFWVAGILDINSKVVRQDTFSSVMGVGLLVGFVFPGIFFYLVSSILIAKHVEDLSIEKYPYGNVIRNVSILVALAGFMFSFWAVFKYINWFGGTGFYLASLTGIIWWGGMIAIVIMIIIKKTFYVRPLLLAVGGLLSLIFLGFGHVLFYEQAIKSQDRLTTFLKEKSIEKVALKESYTPYLTKQLQKRLSQNDISIDADAGDDIVFRWLEKDSLQSFEFLPSMKVDSIQTLAPWFRAE